MTSMWHSALCVRAQGSGRGRGWRPANALRAPPTVYPRLPYKHGGRGGHCSFARTVAMGKQQGEAETSEDESVQVIAKPQKEPTSARLLNDDDGDGDCPAATGVDAALGRPSTGGRQTGLSRSARHSVSGRSTSIPQRNRSSARARVCQSRRSPSTPPSRNSSWYSRRASPTVGVCMSCPVLSQDIPGMLYPGISCDMHYSCVVLS